MLLAKGDIVFAMVAKAPFVPDLCNIRVNPDAELPNVALL